MKTVITLGDMERWGMRMLEVACRQCERRGRLRIDRLIAEHGRDDHGDLRALIAHDCPRMRNPPSRSTSGAAFTFRNCRAGFDPRRA